MKIVTWNCNMKLNSKIEDIKKFNEDIYVIRDCENPLKKDSMQYLDFASNHIWIGDNEHKGLGIFAREYISSLNGEKECCETQATFFMYRHLDKPFHLDHIFASKDIVKNLKIGDEVKWTQLSDHLPLIFEI